MGEKTGTRGRQFCCLQTSGRNYSQDTVKSPRGREGQKTAREVTWGSKACVVPQGWARQERTDVESGGTGAESRASEQSREKDVAAETLRKRENFQTV